MLRAGPAPTSLQYTAIGSTPVPISTQCLNKAALEDPLLSLKTNRNLDGNVPDRMVAQEWVPVLIVGVVVPP